MPFDVIKRQYISDMVFEQLRGNIYRNELKFGEQLLPEKDLAERMQVSKSSVRKAIIQLLERGYLEQRKGQGYFVKLPEAQDPSNPFSYVMTPGKSSLDELMEVRIGLESYGVSLAAERANGRDLLYLQQSSSELTEDPPDRKKAVNADIKFHMGIAFATHNSVYIDLIRRFYDYMFYSISKLHTLLYEKNQHLEIIDKQHGEILAAITMRNTKNAERCMLQHITFLRSFLKGAGPAEC